MRASYKLRAGVETLTKHSVSACVNVILLWYIQIEEVSVLHLHLEGSRSKGTIVIELS